MSHDPASFGVVLRQLRRAAALSQEALAERAGLSLRGVSDLERGARRAPHLTTVRLLADALALDPTGRQALLTAARPAGSLESEARTAASHAPFPVPLTPIIGRERELADLLALVGGGTARLVTLTGTGGTGKTRLALEVGVRQHGDFGDGAVFVDLAPLRDADLVIPTIARAIGVRERLGQTLLETLTSVLATKQVLLLLDNCEHVLGAAPWIAALLATCSQLSVLATSREALRVRGERTYPLLPLPLPAAERHPAIEELALVPAVALFLDRAMANHRDFALTADNAGVVAAICRRLDGLPLAIELAAAWIKVLPPARLLDHLERRLLLLTGGGRDLPPRQRTMRDAIAWSYDLLTPQDQTLFRRLAVFAGGWMMDAAQAVSVNQSNLEVLEGLEALMNASLVQAAEQPDGEQRFGMLETIREFGREQLVDREEADETGRRHAEFYVALAQAGGTDLATAAPGPWLAQLEAEQANLRGALTWLRDHGEPAAGLRLAGALGGFWRLHNASTEGRRWLETFLAQPAAVEATPAERAAALRWAGELAGLDGDVRTAEARLSESLALARGAGEKRLIAGALGALGSMMFQHVDIGRSAGLFAEAAALMRELGDLRQTAFLLAYQAGAVGVQGDLTQAAALVDESEDLLSSLGDTYSFEANFLMLIQGWLAIFGGDSDRADERLQAAMALGRALDSKGMLSATLAFWAELALIRGEATAAAARCREGLLLGWEVGFAAGIAYNLRGLVWLGVHHDEFAPAARLLGTLDALGGMVQQLPGFVTNAHEADLATVRTALGEESFTKEWESGQLQSMDVTIAEAVALADRLMASQR